MSAELVVRAETPADAAAVRALSDAAFGQAAEGALVEALRADPTAPVAHVALVAEEAGAVIGHILFTPVTVGEGASAWHAMALAPMAVRPDRQRDGVGGRLVRAGLDACRARGASVVFVLGHPTYYPRFGFVPAPPRGLTCRWEVPDDVFMVAELRPDALAGRTGRVEYHPEFSRF